LPQTADTEEPLEMRRSLEAFVRGFSTTRSLTHPYEVREIGPMVWLLSDAPRAHGAPRNSEVVAYNTPPQVLANVLRVANVGRHALCVMLDTPAPSREVAQIYKDNGYRLLNREPLFVLDLARRHRFPSDTMRRVVEPQEAKRIATAARGRQVQAEHLIDGDVPIRLYAAFCDGEPIGWCRSVRTHDDCAWVSNLFVQPNHRGRGVGRGLMTAMLDEDERFGIRSSVLLASKTGTRLYPPWGT